MGSHENTHSQIMEYIKKDPDLQKAIELLRREGKVTRVALQFEFGWSEWKARKVYEALRYVCMKGLAYPVSEGVELVCRAFHGEVRLLELHRELDMEIDEEASQERVEEEDWEEEAEEGVEEE
ncbi:hypothetical protein [Stygiolobus caldivivus]|uniref:Uncharacterized protein n=1 Tax=Stygiolobus caldivivus TaxID=2824673 RepID=A0A8D5U8Q6_9CREN|nr:hypothetical protein [Stygiolobus caldivivus]BCU70821.1 hypothetical protein KN1_21180 [Stygiolobus caldivivus]